MFKPRRMHGGLMMEHKKSNIFYISIAIVLLLVPFVGMFFSPGTKAEVSNGEKRELAAFPEAYLEDGTLNVSYLSGLGDYFEDHFALREHMITADALLKSVTVGSGTQDQVIMGKDGWLFFHGSVDDYLGRELLSERELYDIAHNLSLIQEYVEERGGKFLFAAAPNKNSLYGEYMPYNYLQAETSNAQNLLPLLQQEKISTVDLFEAFGQQDEPLYLRRDSHWNNKGAVLAYNELMDGLGKPHEDYAGANWTMREDHAGDLDEMLLPMYHGKELQYYLDKEFSYGYMNDVKDNMDAWIETENELAEGSLLMYRDSFGESLLPLLAEEFNQAYFSRLVPYNLGNVDQYEPGYVIIEKVERNLLDLARQPAIMQAPLTESMDPQVIETQSTMETGTDGPYFVIRGTVDPQYIQNESDIYLSLYNETTGEKNTYRPFYITNEKRLGNGYYLYLNKDGLPQDEAQVQLIVSEHGKQYAVQSRVVQINQEG